MNKTLRLFTLGLCLISVVSCCRDNYRTPSDLISLNINDAKIIYLRRTTSIFEGESSFRVINTEGKEYELATSNESGEQTNATVTGITKITDQILLLKVYAFSEEFFFVNTQTGKMHYLPNNSDGSIDYRIIQDLSNNQQVYQDDNEMIYFSTSAHSNSEQIIKLDTRDFTMEKVLPENQRFTDFHVAGSGLICYYSNQMNTGKIKCLDGSIHPISGIPFICNDKVFSIENGSIYQWKEVNDYTIEKELIQQMPEEKTAHGIINNHLKNTVILHYSTDYDTFDFYEFDGITSPKPIDFHEHYSSFNSKYEGGYRTSDAIYFYHENKFLKLDLETYNQYEVTSKYEVQECSSSIAYPDLLFSGMRYSDGASIIGEINPLGEIQIQNVLEKGYNTSNLIKLN